MIYFAHRGASSLAVQNTLPAFEKARGAGARCYEFDVHLSADKQLVIHHDYSLLSTAGVDVPISALTAAELKQIPLKNSFSTESVYVPLLREVLPIVSPELDLLNIELKNEEDRYPGLEQRLLAELKKFPEICSKIIFSSFDYETLLRLRSLSKHARIGLLTRSFDVSQALSLQAESVHLNYIRLTGEILGCCHQNGLKVYCYTVNSKETATQLKSLGVDGIFTDFIQNFQ